MMIIYKNKGILVPVYVGVSVLAMGMASGVLRRNVGGVFAADYSLWIPVGIGTLIAGVWTLLTSEVHTVINGVKTKVDFESSFFFVPMRIAGWILLGIGLCAIGWGTYLTCTHRAA